MVCQGLVQIESVGLLGQLDWFHLGLAGVGVVVPPVVRWVVDLNLGCLVVSFPGSLSVSCGLDIDRLELVGLLGQGSWVAVGVSPPSAWRGRGVCGPP